MQKLLWIWPLIKPAVMRGLSVAAMWGWAVFSVLFVVFSAMLAVVLFAEGRPFWAVLILCVMVTATCVGHQVRKALFPGAAVFSHL